jgi:DNA-binding MarR family transcriptional regulator
MTRSVQPSRPPRRLPPLLRRAWFALNQAFRQRIAHLGITPDQFTTLRWLAEHAPQPLTQRELAGLMASDANTMTVIVARLEALGLVSRAASATDRRAQLVRLTTTGRRKFAQAQAIALELQRGLLSALPRSRRAAFLRDLETIAETSQKALRQTRISSRVKQPPRDAGCRN